MSRKDSRGLFANVLGQLEHPVSVPSPKPSSSPHLMKVAAGVRQIQERGEVLDQILRDGDHIIDIDPADVAASLIPDRFEGAYDQAAIDEIATSIRERGQIVPGLVRPRAGQPHRYQIVYGRRRLAAARSLGLKFRAVVRELTDEQAIVYQGEENSNRNDLSFIEKCTFALSQERAGYRRDVICASLATGKSHISEMLRIATSIPYDLLVAIGPSPEVGRRRWLELVDAYLARTDAEKIVRDAFSENHTEQKSDRFALALAALKVSRAAQDAAGVTEIRANGFLLATVSYPKTGARVSFTKATSPAFVEFLNGRMESLHNEFLKSTSQTKKG